MKRIGDADSFLVLVADLRCIAREKRRVALVKAHEIARHRGNRPERLGIRGLEQAAADYLERLVLAGRPPLIGHPANHVLETLQRELTIRATDLDIAAGTGRPCVRSRNGDHQHRPRHGPDDLGQRLGEGELRLEGTRRQLLVRDELPGVGHPFVDQDQRRRVLLDQRSQGRSGIGPGSVRIRDHLVGLPPAQLPGKLPPQGMDLRAVRFGVRGAGLQVGSDQGHPPHPELLEPRVSVPGHQVLDLLGHVLRGNAAEQVVEGKHRVGFTATEVGLKVHHGAGVAVAAHATQGPAEQIPQTLGEVGAGEELPRVAVLGAGGLTGVHQVQVGGEFRGGELAARHVVVRMDHFTPRLQPAARLERCLPRPLHLLAGLVLVDGAPQIGAHLAHIGRGIGGSHRLEEPHDGV